MQFKKKDNQWFITFTRSFYAAVNGVPGEAVLAHKCASVTRLLISPRSLARSLA